MIILLTALHIDHSALCPLRVRAAGGALLCSVKVCATNLCCLNLNSQFCCSKHLLPTGQTSPGPEAAIRRSTAHLSSCHLQPNKESHNMVIGDINGILSSNFGFIPITFPLQALSVIYTV